MKWVTVLTHRGLDIKINSLARPDDLGYVIDDPRFAGQKYVLIQEAFDALNKIADDVREGGRNDI